MLAEPGRSQMSMTSEEIARLASKLAEARRQRVCCDPISADVDLTIDDAYAVQQAGLVLRLERGERLVGWKLGYTSLAMREQMGIDEPNFGPLTDAMLMASGDDVASWLIQPRVEPEIGLRFALPLAGEVTPDEVMAAVGEAFAALEVVDSIYKDFRFTLEDNTADGSSAAQVVIGPVLAGVDRLADVRVALRHNDEQVGSATGSAASGHPAVGVTWLVSQLARRGQQLNPGDIVITGGLTKAIVLGPGDSVEAVFDDETRVSLHRRAAPAELRP
jgi:2-keto-4-pentenoate hydratase